MFSVCKYSANDEVKPKVPKNIDYIAAFVL